MTTLKVPSGWTPITGADISYALSGDGWEYWSFQASKGKGAAAITRQLVTRQRADQAQPEIVYQSDATGRGQLQETGGGLHLSVWNEKPTKTGFSAVIPGFVPMGVDDTGPVGNGGSDPQTALTIARLQNELAQLRDRFAASDTRYAVLERGVGALNIKAREFLTPEAVRPLIENIAWAKAADRIFSDLGDPNSGVRTRILDLFRNLKGLL